MDYFKHELLLSFQFHVLRLQIMPNPLKRGIITTIWVFALSLEVRKIEKANPPHAHSSSLFGVLLANLFGNLSVCDATSRFSHLPSNC